MKSLIAAVSIAVVAIAFSENGDAQVDPSIPMSGVTPQFYAPSMTTGQAIQQQQYQQQQYQQQLQMQREALQIQRQQLQLEQQRQQYLQRPFQ